MYHNLRYTTLSFNKIIGKIHSLEEFMKLDQHFWNPQTQQNV